MIFLKHPFNGTKIAWFESEAVDDESNGWSRFDPFAPIIAVIETVAEIPDIVENLEAEVVDFAGRKTRKPRQYVSQIVADVVPIVEVVAPIVETVVPVAIPAINAIIAVAPVVAPIVDAVISEANDIFGD
jgi:hypothetical protein